MGKMSDKIMQDGGKMRNMADVSGAFASLGMGLTGVFTALFLPFVFPF